EKILEIGTGSGYQTAVLAELGRSVFSIERMATLSNRARKVLYYLGYNNISFRIGDGTLGWPEEMSFDAILVTAAAPSIPTTYQEQLAEGGRLILPCGTEDRQELIRVVKKEGRLWKETIGPCRFVKLYGQYGWSQEAC